MSEAEDIAAHIKRLATDALAAEERGNAREAFRLWKEAANSPDLDSGLGAIAAARVGAACMDGDPTGFAEGIKYLKRAAEGGVAEAFTDLGRAYREGKGLPKDGAEAVRCFRKALQAGDESANFDLGIAYLDGQGVPVDHGEAVRFLRNATAIEDPSIVSLAQQALAVCYETGSGVPKNASEGNRYRRLAEKSGVFGGEKGSRIGAAKGTRPQGSGILPALLFGLLAAVLGISFAWRYLPSPDAMWLLLIPLSLLEWITSVLISNSGASAQAAIAEKFRDALAKRPRTVRIGGVLWAISLNEFRHVADNGGDRGVTVQGGSTRDERAAREIWALARRKHTGPYYAAIIAVGGIIGATGRIEILAIVVSAFGLLGAAYALIREFLYRRGYQNMIYAMVLDPDPVSGRQRELAEQKAHGGARLASEAEIVEGASDNSTRAKSLDDLEF